MTFQEGSTPSVTANKKAPNRGFPNFGGINYHRGANNPFTLPGIRSTSTRSPLPRYTGIRSPLPLRSTGIRSTNARSATTQGIRSGCITRTSAPPLTNNRRCKALSPTTTPGRRSPSPGAGSNRCPQTQKGPTTRRKRKSIFIYIFSTPMQGPAGLHKNYLIFLNALINPFVELS